MTEYDIYYDESKEDGYWHGILLVPINARSDLVDYLRKSRQQCPFQYRLHFSKLAHSESPNSTRSKLTESFISIGCGILQQAKFDKNLPKAKIGLTAKIIEPIKAKFVVYRVIFDASEKYNGYRNNLIERTLKSALKSSLHYLFDKDVPIKINRVVFEGEELQGLSDVNILTNLSWQVRDNVKELPSKFITQSSNHQKLKDGQDVNDSYILQLCDSLLGATRFLVVNDSESSVKRKVSLPMKELLKYANQPYPRMKQSRYFRGFSLAQAEMKDEVWFFDDLKLKEEYKNCRQIRLL